MARTDPAPGRRCGGAVHQRDHRHTEGGTAHSRRRGAADQCIRPEVEPIPSVSIMSVPLVHIGGMLGLLVALAKGSTTVVLTRFDAGEWLALVERHRVTTAFLVPTMLYRILEHPTFVTTDLSSLVSLSYGAAPATPELIRRTMDALPGVGLMNTFGQTETMGSITALGPGDHPPERLASVGKPLPGVVVRIVHPTTGEDVGGRDRG